MHANMHPKHPIIAIETLKFKMAAVSVKRPAHPPSSGICRASVIFFFENIAEMPHVGARIFVQSPRWSFGKTTKAQPMGQGQN
jgi:hypothetical protein